VINAILALWMALVGADRLDLAGGHGSFILTPFLALTPVVVVSELIRRRLQGHSLLISRRLIAYTGAAAALVTVVVASVFGAWDMSTSASRAMLLVADVFGTLVVAVLCSDRADLARVFARGAIAGLVVYVAFDVAESLYWIGATASSFRIGPVLGQLGALQNLGPLPRLAGPSGDANRGGFVLIFYITVIMVGEPRVWLRRAAASLGVLLLLATVSRSAALDGAAVLAVGVMLRRIRIPAMAFAGALLLVAAGAATLLVFPGPVGRVAELAAAPLSERFSTTEGSASSHLTLLERGLHTATESFPRAAIGVGYGNSYRVLQDVFPGNRYGNFHSLYVTMLAESGIMALLLVLGLMSRALWSPPAWCALIAGAWAFNVFYQTTTEPLFWFLLAAAWLALPIDEGYGPLRSRSVTSSVWPPVRVMPSVKLKPRPTIAE